jgi:hypothetical protein
MSEERNIRIEDSGGNIYYPHAKAKTTFLESGETIDKYIPDSSLHPVITVTLGNYSNFISVVSLAELGNIPRVGWFTLKITGRIGYPDGYFISCEWKNLLTHDLLYLYDGIDFRIQTGDDSFPVNKNIFLFEKEKILGRRIENRDRDTKIIMGRFLKKIGETNIIKLGKRPKGLKLSCFLMNSKTTVESDFIEIDGETTSDSLYGSYAFIIRNSGGNLDTLFAVWSHIGIKITSEGFEFGINGFDFDFLATTDYKVHYEAII